MDSLTIGYLAIAALFVFLAAGLPVAVAMGVVGVAGMLLAFGEAFAFGQVRTLPYAVTSNYGYAVLPLFVLMGVFAKSAGITADVFRAADLWLRRVRGGLYLAVIAGSAAFAAVSGSTVVNAVVFTRIAFPEMLRFGYSRSLSIGSIAASGSFAAMIPPSLTMVIYAIITEQSIGRLFMAGVVPGVLTALVYAAGTMALVTARPGLAPRVREIAPLAEKLRSLHSVWGVILLAGLVLGGIYAGWFPPSAAGAVGAFGAFAICLLRFRGRMKGWFLPALADATAISCVIFTILIGGLLFSRLIVVTGVVDSFVDGITTVADSQTTFLLLVAAMYLIMGCFLDTTSMMVITLPFIFPAVLHFDIDPIWFGIVLVKLIEISVITPPVGLNLFAVMSAVDKDTTFLHLVKGVLPFLIMELFVLALLIMLPGLATWLPAQIVS
ncbi:MAG: TRAP transporter permease [Rhodospirillales bacterium]